MSSRFPPTSSDNRYPRDRSPRSHDRGVPYSDGRPSEPRYERSESYNARGGPAREPPRGPKAQIGRGAGYIPRGRGFGGRGDGRDRDFRDDTFGRSRGRGQDWDHRERFDARDRRASPPTRTRSRSPFARDHRDARDADPNLRRRDSRDGPLPTASDAFTPRGRGGLRGRGRGDWEYGRAGSYSVEERAYDARSHSRDAQREQQAREYNLEPGKRDEPLRAEREDRDREDRSRSDQAFHRPDSRNSYGPSRSTSTTSMQLATQDRPAQHHRDGQETLDYDRRPIAGTNLQDRSASSRDIERLGPTYRRNEEDRYRSQPSSPPPPPSVPAFGGSLLPRTEKMDQESPTPAALAKEEEPLIHPSRRALMEPSKDPSQPSTDILNAPTAPKAQQRLFPDESTRPGSAVLTSGTGIRDAPPGSNYSKRFPQSSTANIPAAPRALIADQPSVRKALDEEGRNGNVSSSPKTRQALGDANNQTSAVKIPTGPRAERTAPPSIRKPIQPSIRGPINKPPPMIPRAQRQANTWSWVRPGLPQTTPRGPSIMNKVPTKRDLDDEEERPRPSPANSTISAAEIWRQKHRLPAKDLQRSKDEQASDDEQDEVEATAEHQKRSPHTRQSDGLPDELGKNDSANEADSEPEAGMDLDDADFHNAQQNHNREMRRLEAKRPPTPTSHPELLLMLDDLDALAVALKARVEGETGAIQLPVPQQPVGGLPSPKVEDEDVDVKSEQGSEKGPLSAPSIDDLPFFHEGPPTPFSDFEELKPDMDYDNAIRELVIAKIEQDQQVVASAFDFAKRTFAENFKSWRTGLDVIEEQSSLQNQEARAGSTPPESTPEAASAPQTVRSRRMVSEYAIDAIMKESMETAAREERARREREEREAQVYVPVDTFNPEREADIPDMLEPFEVQNMLFADNNNFVEPKRLLDALRYVPPKDDFSKDEHKDFCFYYVTCPKRFGEIAEKIPRRDYRACVRHYYASKRTANYRNQEVKFYKTGRGKRFVAANTGTSGSRPRAGLLASSMDGSIDFEAQNAALTESGRPKRAAAPTFGESAEPENVPPLTTTPARRTTLAKDAMYGPQSAEKPKLGRAKTATTGAKPGRKPGKSKEQPQLILAAAPESSHLRPSIEDSAPAMRTFNPATISEAPRRVDEHEAAQLLANLPTSVQSYPVPSYTENWVTGQSTFSGPMQIQEQPLPRKHENVQMLPQQRAPQQAPDTTSYWSVPEKVDFRNYVAYFGTNWQAIAATLKTKTQQMVCRPRSFFSLPR